MPKKFKKGPSKPTTEQSARGNVTPTSDASEVQPAAVSAPAKKGQSKRSKTPPKTSKAVDSARRDASQAKTEVAVMAPAKTKASGKGAAHAPMHDPKQGKRQDKSSKKNATPKSTRDDEKRAAEAEVKEQPQANDGYQAQEPKTERRKKVEPPRKKGESTEDEKGAPQQTGATEAKRENQGKQAKRAKAGSASKKRESKGPADEQPFEPNAQNRNEPARAETDEGEEVSFANSPFADSPHVSEPSAKSAKSKKQASKAQRSKKAADTTQAEKQPDADTAAETEQVATSQDDDETLIEPAALAPEGEPAGDEDEADESGLFAQELQPEDDERDVLSEEEENRRYLKGILEALLFSSDKPLSGRELARAARIDKKRTLQLLLELRKEYRHRGVNIAEISGGFVLRSNPTYGAYVQKALALRPVRLSRAQLETLAIIAYRQPITRPEIDDIRGVDSGQVLKGLADRDLIKMLGKKDEAGRPLLYGTTDACLDLFSLDSLKGLPSLREFTELSDDSKEKFAQVTGDPMPAGAGEEPSDGSGEQLGLADDVDISAPDGEETTPSEAAAPEGEAEWTSPADVLGIAEFDPGHERVVAEDVAAADDVVTPDDVVTADDMVSVDELALATADAMVGASEDSSRSQAEPHVEQQAEPEPEDDLEPEGGPEPEDDANIF
jgi:segregation and condensation protein B